MDSKAASAADPTAVGPTFAGLDLPGIRTLVSIGSSRRLVAAGIVGLVLAFCSIPLDSDGSLGTDTGGKVATVDAMIERNDWNPSLGYWAEGSDPAGEAHPFFSTRRTEAGWVNVTTLPMIFLTRLLVGLFGSVALLAVPIAGSVITCLATGELARSFGARSWRPGFWGAASSSPLLVYGLDFWEHSIGLGLMISGFAALAAMLSVSASRPALALGALSGLAFGMAATMRTEALIYGLVAGVVAVLWSRPQQGRLIQMVSSGVMAIAALLPLVLNQFLERAVFGASVRSDRAVGAVQSAAGSGFVRRLEEGLLTFASPINLVHPLSILMGAIVGGGLIWFGYAALTDRDTSRPFVLCGLGVLLVFLRLAVQGPTFIPGMLAAVPLAGLGIAVAGHRRRPLPLVLAGAPLPLVWATQYSGAAEAQWAGRYILPSALLLVAAAMPLAGGDQPRVPNLVPKHRRILAGFVAANLVLSAIGFGFLFYRADRFGAANRQVASITGVTVFSDDFLAREAAPLGWNQRWLSAENESERAVVSTVLTANGVDSFVFLSHEDEEIHSFEGFQAERDSSVVDYGFFGLSQRTYVRAD